MNRLSSHCERARLWASLAADAELSELERASFRAHLRACATCDDYARQIDAVAQALRDSPLVEPDRRLFDAPPQRRQAAPVLRLAASAAAVAAALALGTLAGTLSSTRPGTARSNEAATHRLQVQQAVLALMAGSAGRSGRGGRIIPT